MLGLEVFDNGTNAGNLFQGLAISNTSGAQLSIDIFHYSDLEVGGGSTGDSAVLGSSLGNLAIDVSDGSDTTPIIAYGADNFWVSRWNSRNSVLRNLTDGNVDNFSDQGLPFNNNDITVGFQWSRTLDAGSTESFLTQFGSNAPLLDPSVTIVPEPNLAVLLGLGLVGLGARRRELA